MKRCLTATIAAMTLWAHAEPPPAPPQSVRYGDYATFKQQYNFAVDGLDDAIQAAGRDPSTINSHWVCVHGKVLVREMENNRQFQAEFEQDSGRDFNQTLRHWQDLEQRNRADCAAIKAEFEAL